MRDGVRVGDGNTRLNQAETRNTVLVEHANFAVQHRLLSRHVMADDTELGILALTGMARAGSHAHGFFVDETDRSNAVPLHFKQPIVALWWSVRKKGFHGNHGSGHRSADGSRQSRGVDLWIGATY